MSLLVYKRTAVRNTQIRQIDDDDVSRASGVVEGAEGTPRNQTRLRSCPRYTYISCCIVMTAETDSLWSRNVANTASFFYPLFSVCFFLCRVETMTLYEAFLYYVEYLAKATAGDR